MNGNNRAVPNNNETPMNDVNRDRNWTPNVNDNNRGGTNLDGIDNGNGGNNGFINGDNGNNGVNNGGTAPIDGTIIDDNRDRNGTNR